MRMAVVLLSLAALLAIGGEFRRSHKIKTFISAEARFMLNSYVARTVDMPAPLSTHSVFVRRSDQDKEQRQLGRLWKIGGG